MVRVLGFHGLLEDCDMLEAGSHRCYVQEIARRFGGRLLETRVAQSRESSAWFTSFRIS
jgi:protein gp37